MTISNTARKAGPFPGNGVTTAFAFAFKVFQASDLLVVLTDASGNDATQTLSSQYTVALNANQDANPGGTVTMLTPPDSAHTLTIGSQIPYTQPMVLTNTGGFYPTVLNDSADREVALIQQLLEAQNRTLKVSISTPAGVSTSLPSPASNKVISWNNAGTALENRDITDFATAVAFTNWQVDTFTGDGATTLFVLTANPVAIGNTDVSIAGVTQVPNIDYTLLGTALTFTTAPPNGTRVLVRYGRAGMQSVNAMATEYYTATAGQTLFNLSTSYVMGAGALAVYLNGARLTPGEDYTETSTTALTLTVGATLGDRLLVVIGNVVNNATLGASAVGYTPAGTGAVARDVQGKLRELVSAEDAGAVFDNATDSQTALASVLAQSREVVLSPGAVRVSVGNLSPAAKSLLSGSGRESTFLRTTHATNPVIASTAQFVTYRDMSIDRTGAVGGTGIQHWAVNNSTPLEGLLIDRVNLNGHDIAVSIRDLVIGGLRDCYIQSGNTGISIDKTGVNNVSTFYLRNCWIRGNTTIGAQISNVLSFEATQVAFESAGGRTCPLGLRLSSGSSHHLRATWWEALQLNAEFIGCGDVHMDGGMVDGASLTARGFYAANSSGQTTVIFDGAWKVQNLSVPFATADAGAVIIVRTPSLAAYTFTVGGVGSRVIFDFDWVKTLAYTPPAAMASNATATQDVTVTGASVGDLVTVNFDNLTTDPSLFFWTGVVVGPDTVRVLLRNMHTAALTLAAGTLTVRVRKRPITS